MRWKKKGLVLGKEHFPRWAKHTALTPTPVLLEDRIRVFAGFRDDAGVSRIGYADLDRDRPASVIQVSEAPVLDVGLPGRFDDNGVILGDVVHVGNEWFMYYVGFQLAAGVKFLAFTGLATSGDCETFNRFSEVPVLDRSDEGLFIRAIHTVLFDANEWRVWYAAGSRWESIDGKPYPSYGIYSLASPNPARFPDRGDPCLLPSGTEYRIGRPKVFKSGKRYHMLFTKGDRSGSYTPGFAESEDGRVWVRRDELAGLSTSSTGWDSKTLCYPAMVSSGAKTYAFYNGNEMGREGFGYAELIQD